MRSPPVPLVVEICRCGREYFRIFSGTSGEGGMTLELLDRLGVPVGHAFFREAMMAWWFVPKRHEPEFDRVLERLWGRPVTPRLASQVFSYFRGVVPRRDYPSFHGHMLVLLESLG
jgi:hypothetical protein